MIEVTNAYKALGEFSLRGIDLRVETGEYFIVLGPTGAGKTVLLECIAGLHRLDQGRVHLEGRDVSHLAPELRNVAYVPQDYVLFPHMTLRANIAFSLDIRKAPRDTTEARVQELAELLGIAHLLDRRPRTLSGGERQRGALARALAPGPTLLLLDEPLSALDEGTRADLTRELDMISRKTQVTVIHVCHNYDEALELGDRLAVIRNGRVVQVGTPAEVLRRPASEFMARFVGVQNLLEVKSVDRAAGTVTLADGLALRPAAIPEGERLLATLRPEEIAIAPAQADGRTAAVTPEGHNVVPCSVSGVEDRGRLTRLRLAGKVELVATLTRQAFIATGAREGDAVVATFPTEALHVIPAGPAAAED